MTPTTSEGARDPRDAPRARLATARWILWIVGVLTLLVNGIQIAQLKATFDTEVDRELRASGGSLAEVRSRPAEERAEFDEAYAEGLRLARIGAGLSIVVGVVFLICGALVFARPIPATLTGLVLYALSLLAGFLVDPSTWYHGLLLKGLAVAGLIAAVRASFAYEREKKARLDEQTLRETF